MLSLCSFRTVRRMERSALCECGGHVVGFASGLGNEVRGGEKDVGRDVTLWVVASRHACLGQAACICMSIYLRIKCSMDSYARLSNNLIAAMSHSHTMQSESVTSMTAGRHKVQACSVPSSEAGSTRSPQGIILTKTACSTKHYQLHRFHSHEPPQLAPKPQSGLWLVVYALSWRRH